MTNDGTFATALSLCQYIYWFYIRPTSVIDEAPKSATSALFYLFEHVTTLAWGSNRCPLNPSLRGVGTIPPNLITLHTCGNAVGAVKRERETARTVNKLAFKQDNLGLRVLGAKQNTAMENKLWTHGSRHESLNQGGKAHSLSKELLKILKHPVGLSVVPPCQMVCNTTVNLTGCFLHLLIQ